MNAAGNQSGPPHHIGLNNAFHPLPSDFRPPTSGFRPPTPALWSENSRTKQKITKRTHFRFFDLPINTGGFQPGATNHGKNEPICDRSTHHNLCPLVAPKRNEGGSPVRPPTSGFFPPTVDCGLSNRSPSPFSNLFQPVRGGAYASRVSFTASRRKHRFTICPKNKRRPKSAA